MQEESLSRSCNQSLVDMTLDMDRTRPAEELPLDMDEAKI